MDKVSTNCETTLITVYMKYAGTSVLSVLVQSRLHARYYENGTSTRHQNYFLMEFINLNAHVIYEPCIPHDWEIFRKQLQPGPLNILRRVLTIETDDASEARERMAKKKGKKLVGAVKPSVDMGRHDVDPPDSCRA